MAKAAAPGMGALPPPLFGFSVHTTSLPRACSGVTVGGAPSGPA